MDWSHYYSSDFSSAMPRISGTDSSSITRVSSLSHTFISPFLDFGLMSWKEFQDMDTQNTFLSTNSIDLKGKIPHLHSFLQIKRMVSQGALFLISPWTNFPPYR